MSPPPPPGWRFLVFFLKISKIVLGFRNFGYEFLGVGGHIWRWLCRHVRQQISAHVDGGPSGGASMCRPGSKDPNRRERKFYNKIYKFWEGWLLVDKHNRKCICSPLYRYLWKKNRVKPETSTSTSRQPRKLKFGMNAYFNPTRRNMNKKLGLTPHPHPPSPQNRVKP